MKPPNALTDEQKLQVRQILAEAELHLKDHDEYFVDLNETRETNPLDEVWDEAAKEARAAGWNAERKGATFKVWRKTR